MIVSRMYSSARRAPRCWPRRIRRRGRHRKGARLDADLARPWRRALTRAGRNCRRGGDSASDDALPRFIRAHGARPHGDRHSGLRDVQRDRLGPRLDCRGAGRPARLFVGCFYLAQIIVGTWICAKAIRILGLSLRRFAASIVNRSVRGASIASEAWPAFLIGLLLPAAYQTDRLLISHLSTATQLASYNLAIQLFTALLSVIGAGSDALWGHYAHARARNQLPTFAQFVRVSLAFAGVGIVLAAGYIATISPVASIISGDRVSVSLGLSLAVGALLLLQAVHTPSVMVQTDPAGLRFYARLVLGMTLLNIILGLALTSDSAPLYLYLPQPSLLRSSWHCRRSCERDPSWAAVRSRACIRVVLDDPSERH